MADEVSLKQSKKDRKRSSNSQDEEQNRDWFNLDTIKKLSTTEKERYADEITPITIQILTMLRNMMKFYHKCHSKASSWPEGLYGLPKPIDGCPRTNTVTWETGLLFQDCEDTKPKTSRSPSYHLAGFVTRDVQQEFCIKTSTLDDTMNPPWPSGQYCIYQKGIQCPPGLESGWVVWDDESQIIGTNKNTHNGTLPKGIYNTDTSTPPSPSPQSTLYSTQAKIPIYMALGKKRRIVNYAWEMCQTNYCSPLSNAINGKLHPPRCVQTKANVFNDTCTVQCNPGFIPRDITFARSVCRENGRWNSTLVTDCIRKHETNQESSVRWARQRHSIARSYYSTIYYSTIYYSTISIDDISDKERHIDFTKLYKSTLHSQPVYQHYTPLKLSTQYNTVKRGNPVYCYYAKSSDSKYKHNSSSNNIDDQNRNNNYPNNYHNKNNNNDIYNFISTTDNILYESVSRLTSTYAEKLIFEILSVMARCVPHRLWPIVFAVLAFDFCIELIE
ncbi:hypothetical protein QZH41_004430 [Actinostola sp. cb2023]|nr:hypothetical protein QZH41_004430 [Actinostola sp. cb2023]